MMISMYLISTKIHWILLLYLIIISSIKLIYNCKASPTPSSSSSSSSSTTSSTPVKIAALAQLTGGNLNSIISITENGHVANLTRQHDGDLFIANDVLKCNTDTCVGLSSGTAGLFVSDTIKSSSLPLLSLSSSSLSSSSSSSSLSSSLSSSASASALASSSSSGTITKNYNNNNLSGSQGVCECRCFTYLHTYREDLGICVDDIHECTLSPFVSGSSSEKIPYVFLPLRGQIIYPSREISFPNIKTPVCAVTGAQYLTQQGWSELRNPLDTDFPFRMFRDEGRTFLQWLGEPELRYRMQGRLILVHLMCRDMSLPAIVKNSNNVSDLGIINKNIFTPCVAFRVNGSPVKYINNVSEVLFQSESGSNQQISGEGLSTKEYVVIGICSLLLGLIYVASVFLYLHVKKRKNRILSNTISNSIPDINYPKNDQVTFGTSFARNESTYNSSNLLNQRNNGDKSRRNSINNNSNQSCNLKNDIGIIKNNPLLKHYPNLSDHSGFTSDLSNSNSECEDNSHNHHGSINDRMKNIQTSAVIHPSNNLNYNGNNLNGGNKLLDHHYERNQTIESSPSPTQENECLPEENVSIIEDMGTDEKLENMRAIVNGTVRKKLYFNPAYFEPHLLMSPPPAAIEFLTKIREVIAIAKYKMASKRYQPSLQLIPEESQLNGSEIYYNSKSSQKDHMSNIDITKTQNSSSNHLDCSGCPGCSTNTKNNNKITDNSVNDSNKCNNCRDKRNSIEKWLESVPSAPTNISNQNETNTSNELKENNTETKSNSSSPKSKISVKSALSPKQHEMTKKNMNESVPIKRSMITAPKCKPPPIPETVPKIVSHSLKSCSFQKTPNIKNVQNRNHNITNVNENSISPILNSRLYGQNNNIYMFPETGTEIYNNPKFNHFDSPCLSQRSRSSSHRSRSSKKRIEVLDQYANPKKSDITNQYDILKSMKHMPDMVYEAIAKDYSMRNFNIPTPDYDGSFEKRMKDVYNNTQGSDPSVPTPDYSTLGKKSLRQYQPDSPIYRRKSPQYLIVDYETDSLERNTSNTNKKTSNSLSPGSSSNNSSDPCSQPSPSLSAALPLEEEVEIRHTIYDKIEGLRKDGVSNIKKNFLLNDNEFNCKHTVLEPRIKYDTPFRGSMTIEVEHEPLSDVELSTDSEQFEPDTLDRKPKKYSFCDVKNAWSEHLKKSQNFVNNSDGQVSYSSLENMTSLPEFNPINHNDHLVLRLCNSFRNNIENNCPSKDRNSNDNSIEMQQLKPAFGSLREIYQSKNQKQLHHRPKLTNIEFQDQQGRILTLEAKHSKRQRKCGDDIAKKLIPPDIIPANKFYDIPKFQNKLDETSLRKNLAGWNIDNFNRNTSNNIDDKNQNKTILHEDTETVTSSSESTEITGVSDTQANSEFENCENSVKAKNRNISPSSYNGQENCHQLENGAIYSKRYNNNFVQQNIKDEEYSYSSTEYSIYRLFSDENETDNRLADHNEKHECYEDLDRIEIISTKSLSNGNVSRKNSISNGDIEELKKNEEMTPSNNCSQHILFERKPLNIQTVYRVEVSPPSNGMQIAIGLRNRAKKSKDLKNAWKKFISLATSKFNNYSNSSDRKISNVNREEGIPSTSLIDDNNSKMFDSICIRNTKDLNCKNLNIGGNCNDIGTKRFGLARQFSITPSTSLYYDNQRYGQRQELDSGYMSADSNEVYTRRFYEKYNFKQTTEKEKICKFDTIEDKSEHSSAKNKSSSQKSSISTLTSSSSSSTSSSSPSLSSSSSNTLSSSSSSLSSSSLVTKSELNDKLKRNESIIINQKHKQYHEKFDMKCNKMITSSANIIYSSENEDKFTNNNNNNNNNNNSNNSNCSRSSESDEEGNNTEDMCESGAESVETNSVLFKNIRNINSNKMINE